MGEPWKQQELCKLQSAPTTLLNGSDTLPGSSNNAFLLYAALQDKSVHKYRLNMSALLTPSKTKVPTAHHQCISCWIDTEARQMWDGCFQSTVVCSYVLSFCRRTRFASRLAVVKCCRHGLLCIWCFDWCCYVADCHTSFLIIIVTFLWFDRPCHC